MNANVASRLTTPGNAGVRLGNRLDGLARLEPDLRGRQPAQQVDPRRGRQCQCRPRSTRARRRAHPRSRTKISRCFAFSWVYEMPSRTDRPLPYRCQLDKNPFISDAGPPRQASGRPDGIKGRSGFRYMLPQRDPCRVSVPFVRLSANHPHFLLDIARSNPLRSNHVTRCWWPGSAACRGRRTGNPVRIRNGPAAVTVR